ncbi:MAG: hypothetical protein ACM3OB_09465 [Acidobacteriota bacterium]
MRLDECLIVRGGGVLWGVPRARVRVLARAAGLPRDVYRVELGGRALAVDEVLGFSARLEVRPLGAVLRRFWSAPALGLALHDGRPVVVVDPDLPPSALLTSEEPHG